MDDDDLRLAERQRDLILEGLDKLRRALEELDRPKEDEDA
jgi:hypothetical protein